MAIFSYSPIITRLEGKIGDVVIENSTQAPELRTRPAFSGPQGDWRWRRWYEVNHSHHNWFQLFKITVGAHSG